MLEIQAAAPNHLLGLQNLGCSNPFRLFLSGTLKCSILHLIRTGSNHVICTLNVLQKKIDMYVHEYCLQNSVTALRPDHRDQ